MARPRKPTALLKASGAFKKNPDRGRARVGEPKPIGPLGPPPKSLTVAQLECWERIVAADTAGVLTSADDIAVQICAELMAEQRKHGLETADRAQLIKLLGDFGMTPRGRSYVKGSGENQNKPKNPFADA